MGEDFENAVAHRERAVAEAGRMYGEDRLIRHICDMVVSEAMSDLAPDDPEAAHFAVRKAVMTAIALVASNKPDVSFVMLERDKFRDQLIAHVNMLPGIPVLKTTPGGNLDTSMLVDK